MSYGVYPFPITITPKQGNHYATIKQEKPKDRIMARIRKKENDELVRFEEFGYGELTTAIDWCNNELAQRITCGVG